LDEDDVRLMEGIWKPLWLGALDVGVKPVWNWKPAAAAAAIAAIAMAVVGLGVAELATEEWPDPPPFVLMECGYMFPCMSDDANKFATACRAVEVGDVADKLPWPPSEALVGEVFNEDEAETEEGLESEEG
jgi:hypothetical protein